LILFRPGIYRCFEIDFYDLLRGFLILLGILPQGPIQIPHRYGAPFRQLSARLNVFPPIVERVKLGLFFDAERPQGPEVDDRVRIFVREVQDNRCRRQRDPMQKGQNANPQLLIWRG
jgi:hypothetical protein